MTISREAPPLTQQLLACPLLKPGQAILACGAGLKNAACLLGPDRVLWSPVHGDLSDPAACQSLQSAIPALLAAGLELGWQVQAVAHDLHPDFYSTRLALDVATRWDAWNPSPSKPISTAASIPAIAVQHHQAHVAVAQALAQFSVEEPCLGLALDGVGYGNDGQAWGGELLWVQGAHAQRLGHLQPLALPGGDLAARQAWRMGASVLHSLGMNDQIEPWYAARVGHFQAQGVANLLARGLRCPSTSSLGRWFDAAASLLDLCHDQTDEAQAARSLQAAAEAHLLEHRLAHDELAQLTPTPDAWKPRINDQGILDLRPWFTQCLRLLAATTSSDSDSQGRHTEALAWSFHHHLIRALADWLESTHQRLAASPHGNTRTVALSGGCFFNPLLSEGLTQRLRDRGFQVLSTEPLSVGDASLALGQAWVAACRLQQGKPTAITNPPPLQRHPENCPCA